MIVVLIPCGPTEWQTEGRLLGRVELPPSGDGAAVCAQWAENLRALGMQCILHGPDELTAHTALTLARQLSVSTKALDDLLEVDTGLWTGLTDAQLKTRFASAHRELRESPLNVSPPGGEALSAAVERITACVRKQIKKNGRTAIGVVLRPVAFAIVKCALERGCCTEVWDVAQHADAPVVIEHVSPGRQSGAVLAGRREKKHAG